MRTKINAHPIPIDLIILIFSREKDIIDITINMDDS